MFWATIGGSKIIGTFKIDGGINVNSEYCSKTFSMVQVMDRKLYTKEYIVIGNGLSYHEKLTIVHFSLKYILKTPN